jgi:hypothetical protein
MPDPSVHQLIVERIDGDVARVEVDGGDVIAVPRWLLPEGAAPDLVLRVERAATRVTIAVDDAATGAARADSARLTEELRARDDGGDVAL